MNNTKEVQENPRASINYLFFGFYFAIIALVHVYHVFLIEPLVTTSTFFYAAYALGQCLLETLVLILFAGLVNHFFPRFMNFYILVVFFLFLSHLIDFTLVRLMDLSFWYALNFVTQLTYENFIELLIASNVSLFIWAVAGICAVLVIGTGLFFYRFTEKWTVFNAQRLTNPVLAGTLCTICLFLITWDVGMRGHASKTYFDRYQKTLPWKNTFFPHKPEYLSLSFPLREAQGEEELMQKLDSRVFSLARKPDIYLFVIESLREDFITDSSAPNMKKFKEDNVSFPMGLSNANATHIAWFSLCYSQFPFYWGKIDPEEWKGGSIPLRILKKMGYKIHVSSSARLGYFHMDRVIFGEGQHLADSLFAPEEDDLDEPYVKDQKSIDNLLSEMNKEGSGRFFLVFLDATHFDYSWPKNMTRFTPYEEKVNYFKAALSTSGVEGIKNRYRNAIHHVDSLFGRFYEALKKSPGGKEAVVVVTGDHGEEFYEQGNLFHASSLTHPQMHIPLYYRFGEKEEFKRKSPCPMSCQMDVFPTLFHYLVGEDLMGEVLQGQSIFKQDRWPYTIVARFNAIRSPSEFCIHNGSKKILAEFTDERDIFSSKGLKILSTKNCLDENLFNDITAIQDDFGKAFERIFPDAR